MENQLKFVKSYVIPKIISESKELKALEFTNININSNSTIDGFMGNIIFASLEFKTEDNNKKDFNVVVKLMKPPSTTRTSLDVVNQFINEVLMYKNVIPTFLSKFQTNFRSIDKNLWCPRIYLTEIGKYPELSEETETILVMENLAEKDFRLGPRINLTLEELTLMTKAIAQFHACTYALRINEDPDFDKLVNEIIPFGFKSDILSMAYCSTMDRLFTYLDNNPKEIDSETFATNLKCLKAKYGTVPLKLMQRFLKTDNIFSVILHGDYNRNNVLFKYEENTAVDLRFIDFQEVKYGSPALDLSFFLFMNVHPNLFAKGLSESLHERLINLYHVNLVESLCELLDCDQQDTRLSPYSWNNFYDHYKYFALYGVMVSAMFIPWMTCPEDECAEMAQEFEKDAHSSTFKELTLTCGGKETDQRIVAVLRHASELGYMEMMEDD